MSQDPESVIEIASAWLEAGARVALATVTRTWSSSPRPPGSQMAIDARGRFEGSVSGGCVETAVVEASLEFLADGMPRTLEFGVADQRAWEVGLACGGRVEVFVGPAEPEPLRRIATLRAARATFGVALDLATGRSCVLMADELSPPLRAAWEELACGDEGCCTLDLEGRSTFLRLERPAPRLLIIGAVHIAQVLTRLAILAGFEVIVIDPRALFASDLRFPDVKVVGAWPERALQDLRLDRRTALVALSHDPKLDDPALRAALRSAVFYVGALGSRKTQAARRQRLADAGFEARELDRISGPIGLPIGARTTAEIAISIMAEVIARWRGGGA